MSAGGQKSSGPAVIALLIGVAVGFAFLSAGVPDAPPSDDDVVTHTLSSSAITLPPIYSSFMTGNNAREGAPFQIDVHAPQGTATWLLASLQPGTTTIGGQPADLGPDWFVLRNMVWTDASEVTSFALTLPTNAGLGGVSFRLQGVVYDPQSDLVVFTNGAPHEVTTGSPFAVRVCLIRQSVPTVDMLNPTEAPDTLAAGLRNLGLVVDVYDDYLPALEVLARYDVLFDCRFVLPPSEQEKQTVTTFMQNYGGVFLLHGPFSWSPWSNARKFWIDDLIMNRLGIPVTIHDGGMGSDVRPQVVSGQADPTYLNYPGSVQGTPYDVKQEGSHFGLIGEAQAGTEWIVDAQGPWSYVYGMLFRPSDMPARTMRGSLAVLWSGNPAAFTSSPGNPSPDMIMYNLAFWLDI